MATATAPATATPVSIIPVSEITATLNVDVAQFLQYCAMKGIEVGIPDTAIPDFSAFITGFRSFQAQEDAAKLSSLFQQSPQVAVTPSETNGNAETMPPATEATETVGQWKLGKKGKSMTETVQFLIAENDPDYQSGFAQALKNRSQNTVELMERVANLHYGEMPGRVKRLWTAVDKYLETLGVTATPPAKKERKPRGASKKTKA